MGGIKRIEKPEEFNELAAAMTILDQSAILRVSKSMPPKTPTVP
jgi:hypothetical protein